MFSPMLGCDVGATMVSSRRFATGRSADMGGSYAKVLTGGVMGKDIVAAVREICLSFPEAEAPAGKGAGSAEDAAFSALAPDFKVRGKTFATLAVNHHGDGRIALWVHSPPGAQALHVEGEGEFYFVPPYVGMKGWPGVTSRTMWIGRKCASSPSAATATSR